MEIALFILPFLTLLLVYAAPRVIPLIADLGKYKAQPQQPVVVTEVINNVDGSRTGYDAQGRKVYEIKYKDGLRVK